MVHELLTIDNNRVDLRELGNKVSLHTSKLRERPPLTRHIFRLPKRTKSWCSQPSKTRSSERTCTATTVSAPG